MKDFATLIARAEKDLNVMYQSFNDIETTNTRRVLGAFQRAGLATRHFAPTTGYGYDDIGRDTLDKVFADVFGTEKAIVRPQIASGTAALSLCLFGLARPGDHILSVTGMPYDTMDGVIGISSCTPGSLREMGITFSAVELTIDGKIDMEAVKNAIRPNTTVVMVQRSRGYAWRPSLMPEDVRELAKMLDENYPNATMMVDNCYGEFVRENEPSHFGAHVLVGSLIKNPGGGLAPTGSYIVGREKDIEKISYRLTAPGIGLEVGSYAASYQPFFQGLFMAPHVVMQAVKISCLTARVFELLGMKTIPSSTEPRADIIEAIEMQTPESLIAFCQGIQMASPIDSMALPEPWAMPGYQDEVIMAAGTFISGASIELSADAPMRAPYICYMQGGLTYAHGKIAIQTALERMQEKGCL